MSRFRKDYIARKVRGALRKQNNEDARDSLMCPFCGKEWPDRTYASKIANRPVEVRAYVCRNGCHATWHELRVVSGRTSGALVRISRGMIS